MKTDNGYVFYDTETTGTVKGYDQILQIAAIRTNGDLDVIDHEKAAFDLRCRRLSYQVPSPSALLVTDLEPDDLERAPLSHYELVRAVHTKFAEWSPSIFCGFNSIRFDEMMLRQAFFQTLHPIYQTQIEGNRRADALVMARSAAIHAPHALQFDAGHSFRLRDLARTNGIAIGTNDAHDAMADTRATLQLMRLIRDRAPSIFAQMMQNSDKAAVLAFAKQTPVFRWSGVFGPYRLSECVTYVGSPEGDPNALLFFNLAYDPEKFFRLSEHELEEFMFGRVKPFRIARANSFPILMPLETPVAGLATKSIGESILQQRAEAIARNLPFRKRVLQILQSRSQDRPQATFVEDRIYEGFISDRDTGRCAKFHEIPWEQRPALIRWFQDPRLRELAARLIFVERPDVLPDELRKEITAWQMARIEADIDVPWLSAPAAVAELQRMWGSSDPATREKLERYAAFIGRIRSVATQKPHVIKKPRVIKK